MLGRDHAVVHVRTGECLSPSIRWRNWSGIINTYRNTIGRLMSLSTPAARELLHTRNISCKGYKRVDGLYDIEGHLVDTKSYDIDNIDRGGVIHSGESLHEMRVRLTLDLNLLIHHAEAITEWAPYSLCKDGGMNISRLEGVKIGPGWRKTTLRLLGKTHGCTHITEMLGQMATTAYQTMGAEWNRRRASEGEAQSKSRPRLLNSCYAFAESGEVVLRQWPQWHQSRDSES